MHLSDEKSIVSISSNDSITLLKIRDLQMDLHNEYTHEIKKRKSWSFMKENFMITRDGPKDPSRVIAVPSEIINADLLKIRTVNYEHTIINWVRLIFESEKKKRRVQQLRKVNQALDSTSASTTRLSVKL